MIEVQVGETEKRDIRAQVDRVLRDLGYPEPPLSLRDVRATLKLDLQYYRSSDPGLLAELTHRFKMVALRTIPDVGKHLLAALSKSRLCAFWIPDGAKIMLDSDVPEPKHRWIEAHEIAHSITPWHKEFMLGDTLQMVDPACRAILEAEANYGASRLVSLQDRFAADARDLDLSFNSIKLLAKRYDNSIVSTLWRTVEDRNPNEPVFGIVSVHPHHPEIGKHDGPNPWRYFIRSDGFRTQFSNVSPEKAFELITLHASHRKTGPVFSAQDVLEDALGNSWEFQIHSFSTKHALLTFGFPIRACSVIVPAA